MIRLQFSTRQGTAARAIEWFTWSPFSHVDLVLPDGKLLGARFSGGVAVREPVDDCLRLALFDVDAPAAVLEVALGQVGKPYDWDGALGFGLRRQWQAQDAWFCSELVAWAFLEAGFPLLRTEHCSRISPRDLLLSPFLQPVPMADAKPGML